MDEVLFRALSSLEGIGLVSARKVAENENAVDILINDKDTSVFGLPQKKIDIIRDYVIRQSVHLTFFAWIKKMGISDTIGYKIEKKYGVSNALNIVKENPYKILTEYEVDFITVDKIGLILGKNAYDKERIKALIRHCMSFFTANGSVYAETDKLIAACFSLNTVFTEVIPKALICIAIEEDETFYIDYDKNRVYIKDLYKAERMIEEGVKRLTASKRPLPFNKKYIKELEKSLKIKYSESQKTAFNCLMESGVKIITGGPGTGKTLLIQAFVKIYKKMYPNADIVLCAPTGMAAENMAIKANYTAQTIHKVLDFKPFGEIGVAHKSFKNPILAKCIIVDEVSMVDTELFAMLIDAIRNGSLVLLFGDYEQLDSVMPGMVLKDIIRAGCVDVYELTEGFRQSKDSTIVKNAEAVQNGGELTFDKSFFHYEYKDKDDLYRALKSIWGMFDVQILSTTKLYFAGTKDVNLYIQQVIGRSGRAVSRKGYTFYTGDKIILTHNNYEAGYLNGDIGTIKEITDDLRVTITIRDKDIEMEPEWMDDLELAYAVTVHKSQGSEFDTVVIILPKRPHGMLDVSLLYTAVTRAKKRVIILSSENSLETAMNTHKSLNRKTSLFEKEKNHEQEKSNEL